MSNVSPGPVRREFEMSEAQYKRLLDGINQARNAPYIIVGGYGPGSPQDAANRLWCELGQEMGFDGMTAMPSDRGPRFFTAVVTP
jgi:hypothetical protein